MHVNNFKSNKSERSKKRFHMQMIWRAYKLQIESSLINQFIWMRVGNLKLYIPFNVNNGLPNGGSLSTDWPTAKQKNEPNKKRWTFFYRLKCGGFTPNYTKNVRLAIWNWALNRVSLQLLLRRLKKTEQTNKQTINNRMSVELTNCIEYTVFQWPVSVFWMRYHWE